MSVRRGRNGMLVVSSSTDYHASCENCPWELHARNAMGAAAQHAYRTRHEVFVDTMSAVSFRREEDFRRPTTEEDTHG